MNTKLNFDQQVRDYKASLIHQVYNITVPSYDWQEDHIKDFPHTKPTAESKPGQVIDRFLNRYFRVIKGDKTYIGKLTSITPVPQQVVNYPEIKQSRLFRENIYYTMILIKNKPKDKDQHFTWTSRQIKEKVVKVFSAIPPTVKHYPQKDNSKLQYHTTMILSMDKKAKKLQGPNIETCYKYQDVKELYYAGLVMRPIITQTEEMQIMTPTRPFNQLIVQMWRLKTNQTFTDFMKWAILNMESIHLQVKDISTEDKEHLKDIITPVNVDEVIMKGDFNTYNDIMAKITAKVNRHQEQIIIDDSLFRIAQLYTPEIMQMLHIKNKNLVLTPRFEEKMLDAILKYGREYSIALPPRTTYESEYVAFIKDLMPQAANNTFKGSMVIYEDPNDQKDFINNSKAATLPRSKKDIEAQAEELVNLHTSFVTLMYLVKTKVYDDLLDSQEQFYDTMQKRTQKLQEQEIFERDYSYFKTISNTEVVTYRLK